MTAHFVLPCGSSILILRSATPIVQGERADPQPVRRVERAAPVNQAPAGGETNTSTKVPDGPKGQAGAPEGNPCMQTLPLILGMFALMYFLVIRPQQKQEKQRREMLGSLKKGDDIVTSGGLYGEVESLDEKTVIVRVGLGEGMRVKLDRSAVARVGRPETAADSDGGKGGDKA